MRPLEWALLSRTEREILRIFHGFKSRSQDIFIKQASLARMITVTREHVNRCIGRLAAKKFIRRAARHSRFIVYVLEIIGITPERTPQITSQRPDLLMSGKRLQRPRGAAQNLPIGNPKPTEGMSAADLADLEAFIRGHEARFPAAWSGATA